MFDFVENSFHIIWACWILIPTLLGFGFTFNYATIFVWVMFLAGHFGGVTYVAGLLRRGARNPAEKPVADLKGKPVIVQGCKKNYSHCRDCIFNNNFKGALWRVIHLVIVASAQSSSNIVGSWQANSTLSAIVVALGILVVSFQDGADYP